MSRLPDRGLIDRAKPVEFRFQGKAYQGFEGDTLASALLANDVRLMGRSFKYHRPRGVMTAGSEEPNALMEIGVGAHLTPNVRATVQEIYPGLDARAQNYVGHLGFDLMRINDLLTPFIGAGFYYKTFMWPQSFWEKLYEPLIRRAAGLGRLSGLADPDTHHKAWAHCDLLVIGGGPAGLMAALTAGRAGRDVILADEDFRFGGRLNSETGTIARLSVSDWAASAEAELQAMPNVRLMARTTVTGAYDGGTYGALERVSEHLPPSQAPCTTYWRIVAGRAVLASGAHERPIAFPGNDRPGVMLASAVRTYVQRFGVAPGKRVVVFANNADGIATARALMDAGVKVGAVVSPCDSLLGFNCRSETNAQIVATRGRLGLAGVKLRRADGQTEWLDCDCLAISGGWNPAVHLTCHLGGRPVWREDVAAFVPKPGAVPGLLAAGAVAGDFSTYAALKGGAEAASEAMDLIGVSHLPKAEDGATEITPFWYVDAPGRAWLDFQNDVTVKDVRQAHLENFRSVEHMKRYTTLGMATDQGKTSNMGALAIMAEMTGRSIPETGTTTFRPPYVGVPIASLGAGAAGKGFAPERFTTSHAVSVEKGAVQMEAGLWYRPAYYPRDSDVHWREACDREVTLVREAVGICDVSTLGKIDVQGPDAGAFLDFVYGNVMSSLAVGRVRYGVMLREDGFVMDDGTCARLAPDHFVVTTTTAAAGQVMAHLEFVHQGLRPELDVRFISVTEQWAQIAVAGPKSRALLDDLVDQPITDATFPFMGCGDVTLGQVSARLFRISFSGEHAYEIAVPARFGEAVMRALVRRAEDLGGGLYGMEALNVLRIEKGHITHAEIHGRTTAADCGMAKMVSSRKECIGKVMAARPHLISADREQLVGIKPVGAVQRLFGGSHIIEPDAEPTRVNGQGYVTSVCYSPALGHMIGLAFIKNGHARIGTQVRAVDLLCDFDTLCEICELPFFDADGGRLRG